MNRRDFLKIFGIGTAGLLVGSLSSYIILDESDEVFIAHVSLPIKNLHPALEGFRIVQLSDIHLAPLTKLELIQKAVIKTNRLKPDLIVLTGDYIWLDVEAIFDLAPVLAQLDAKYGVVSIIGNHDIWEGLDIVKVGFREARLPLYANQGIPLQIGKGNLHIACLDDAWSGTPDLNIAMQNWVPDSPVVLLLHEPDPADFYSLDERISIQLSGHTHGGQVRLPGIGALILPHLGKKYDYRLYRVHDMWLYTNPGIGVINEPVRFHCPAEITEIILYRA